MEKTTAQIFMDITELWDNTPKSVMVDNIERFLGYSTTFRGHKDNTRLKELEEMTESSRHTVNAWMNRSRENVKIPLLKLCKISEYLGITVEELLNSGTVNNRKWEVSDNISVRQARLFNTLNETKYFQNGEWDIQSLIKDMDMAEDYSNGNRENQLMEDCLQFFKSIFRVRSGVFIDNVRTSVNDYLSRKENDL